MSFCGALTAFVDHEINSKDDGIPNCLVWRFEKYQNSIIERNFLLRLMFLKQFHIFHVVYFVGHGKNEGCFHRKFSSTKRLNFC